jgi:SAM-dependent methyltransferase
VRRDPTQRFTSRVDHYARCRPSYPSALIGLLREQLPLSTNDVVADVGSGTGLLSELFLENGNPVVAVEPNRAMREAAERLLGAHHGFRSIDGRAEATGLEDGSVDVVAAGQAFHWFDRPRARAEFSRILRPDGRVVLVWNDRQIGASSFMAAYEDLLTRHGTDYRQVDHQRRDEEEIRAFLAGGFRRSVMPNMQRFDRQGLRGRLLSSSYAPGEDEPGHDAMLRDLDRLFDLHQVDGRVQFDYETVAYLGTTGWLLPVGPGAR